MNILSISRIYFETNFDFAKIPQINNLFHDFTMNLLFISRINYKLTICVVISISFSRIYYGSAIFFANSLSFSQIYFDFSIFVRIYNKVTIFFAILLLIHSLLRETICLTNSLWIHLVFREVTMNSLSVSQWHYEFTILLTTQVWFDFLFQWFTINYAYILWLHFLFREFPLVSLFFAN